MDQYQRFFDELAPRLETARELERELDAHLARRFNVFDYLRTDELGLSRIIADLLNPAGKHGQGPIFLELLLDGIGWKGQSLLKARSTISVEVEKAIDGGRRIDIFVHIGGYCLAIENKPYAGDQPSQVLDYLVWLRKQALEKYALVYLSPSGDPPSSESVDLRYLAHPDAGHFLVMPYYEAVDKEWEDGFDDFRIDYTLKEWFSDCRKNCNVDRLCWILREAEVFVKQRFGGRTMGSRELDAVDKFVTSDTTRWDVGLEIHRALPQVMQRTFSDFVRQIERALLDKYTTGFYCRSGYYSPKRKACLGLHKESWTSASDGRSTAYNRWSRCTQIQLEAWSRINQWTIGVRSDNEDLSKELKTKFEGPGGCGKSVGDWPGWAWWQWVDLEYRDWESQIPTLRRECEEGDGDFTKYFVGQFERVAEVAIPIIDDYEGRS